LTRPSDLITSLEADAEFALFQGKINGIIAMLYENERPLQGLAGLMDWYFRGEVSQYVRRGVISGKPGECIYIPILKQSELYHLFLAGGGQAPAPGERSKVPDSTLTNLLKNLRSLKLSSVGVSRRDFGGMSDTYVSQKFKGIPICVIQ
jgi:hypothetical protein